MNASVDLSSAQEPNARVSPKRRRSASCRRPRKTVADEEPSVTFDSVESRQRRSSRLASVLKPKELVVLESAILALHGSDSTTVIGRISEMTTITQFLQDCLACRSSGVLYLSGSPGTGKTLCAIRAMESLAANDRTRYSPKMVFLNAVNLSDSLQIFQEVGLHLGVQAKDIREFPSLAQSGGLESVLNRLYTQQQKKRNMTVILIDEVDQIRPGSAPSRSPALKGGKKAGPRPNDLLLSLFNFATDPKSKMVLIAIANDATLSSQLLSRIDSKEKFKSVLFEPYKVDQLREILQSRLAFANTSNDPSPLIDQRALEFGLRKIAAFHGDCRQALDACRRTLAARLVDVRSSHEPQQRAALLADEEEDECSEAGEKENEAGGRWLKKPCSSGERSSSMSSRFAALSLSKGVSKLQHLGVLDDDDGASTQPDSDASVAIITPTSSTSPSPSNPSPVQKHKGSVGLEEMQKVLNTQYRDEKAKTKDLITGLPQQCKIILCAACHLANSQNCFAGRIDLPTLQNQYNAMCKRFTIPIQPGMTNLLEGLTGLESAGFLSLRKSSSKTPARKLPGARCRKSVGSTNGGSCEVILNMSPKDMAVSLEQLLGIFGTMMN